MSVLAVLAVVAGSVAVAGCDVPLIGPTRSAQSFCKVYWQQKHAYLAKYDQRSSSLQKLSSTDPLAGTFGALGSSLEAVGDVVVIFDKLDKVAPDDIEPDVAAIRDALKKSVDDSGGALSDPLGTIAGNLALGLSTLGSWNRVGDYVVDRCGESR